MPSRRRAIRPISTASLWRRPAQFFGMLRLAQDAAEGFRGLRQCRDLLGHGFGMHDLGEIVGEVELAVGAYGEAAPADDSQLTASANAS